MQAVSCFTTGTVSDQSALDLFSSVTGLLDNFNISIDLPALFPCSLIKITLLFLAAEVSYPDCVE